MIPIVIDIDEALNLPLSPGGAGHAATGGAGEDYTFESASPLDVPAFLRRQN